MKLILHRFFCGPKHTIGRLYKDGIAHVNYLCDMLEDPVRDINRNGVFDGDEKKEYGNTAIPYGVYKVILSYSPKFKRQLPLLLNVPHFEGIRIHSGNTVRDTKGCPLPGLNTEVGKVTSSKLWENKICALLAETQLRGESNYIVVAADANHAAELLATIK